MTIEYASALGNHTPVELPNEQTYADAWLQEVAHKPTLTAQAVQGGLLADRMAWVFVAGYQCALRHTFAELPADCMAAFAVAEDRKGNPPLPGVTATEVNGAKTANGYKTWVACSATLSHLVIKADRGAVAKYYCLERGSPGLTLTPKYGAFLAEMSQGVAELSDVAVAKPLDASQVHNFGIRETLYIYTAFCAWAGKSGASVADCQSSISRLAVLIDKPPEDAAALAELKAVDDAVQSLRAAIADGAAPRWQQDQRLIAMYSPGIQKRELA